VDGVLRRSARRVPGRTAVRYGDRPWTYGELDEAVSAAAADRVASYGHNSDAYLIGFLACARAGLVHVPVNHNLTGEDLHYILRQSGSSPNFSLGCPVLLQGREEMRPWTCGAECRSNAAGLLVSGHCQWLLLGCRCEDRGAGEAAADAG
jgi:AMP-binding enzyme